MMRFTRVSAVISLVICIISGARAASHSGFGTAYSDAYEIDKTGFNACQFNSKKLGKKWNVFYAALNEADWDDGGAEKENGVCGKCIRACGDAGCVVTMIVDLCPGWACDRGNVDFSMPALEAATGFEWDRKPITWDFVDCDDRDDNLTGIDASDTDKIATQSTHVLDDIQDVINIIQNGPVQIGI